MLHDQSKVTHSQVHSPPVLTTCSFESFKTELEYIG